MNTSSASRIESLWSALKTDTLRKRRSASVLLKSVYKSAAAFITVTKKAATKGYEYALKRKPDVNLNALRELFADGLLDILKHSPSADTVLAALAKAGSHIQSSRVSGYCNSVWKFLAHRYQTTVPEKWIKHPSYAFSSFLGLVLFGSIVFGIGDNWGNYPETDTLAAQETSGSLMQDENEESLFHTEASFNHINPTTADNHVSQPVTSKADPVVPQNIVSQEKDHTRQETLFLLVNNIAALDEDAISEQIKTESDFLSHLEQSPHTIASLLNVYEQLPEGETKDLLHAYLATKGSQVIEQRIIAQLSTGDLNHRSGLLALLRDTGLHSMEGRNSLLKQLPVLQQPEDISSAILAFTPEIVSASQRTEIINQLSPYLNHNNEIVRSATVESLSRWVDSNQSYILENALTDASEQVRQAAVNAAFTSTIQSDSIKTLLLDIMRDENELLPLRMDAHSALTSYTLQGSEYEDFYQFHKKQTENFNIEDARG